MLTAWTPPPQDQWRVDGPIPGTAAIRGLAEVRYGPARAMPPIAAGGRWTLLVVAEDGPESRWYTRRCIALRYALVTRDAATGDLVACGPAEFLARATGRRGDGDGDETAGAYVPGHIKHLVRECNKDEVDEVAGPFWERHGELVDAEAEARFERQAARQTGSG